MEITRAELKAEIESFSVQELRAAALISVRELVEMLTRSDAEFAAYLKLAPYSSPTQRTLTNLRKKEIQAALSEIFKALPAYDVLRDQIDELDGIVSEMIRHCEGDEVKTDLAGMRKDLQAIEKIICEI